MQLMHKNRSESGDTIIEVLICLAIIGLMLGASFGLSNRNTQANRQSIERSEAFKQTTSQIELLKSYLGASSTPSVPPPNSRFCINADATAALAVPSTLISPIDPEDFEDELEKPGNLALKAACKSGDLYYSYIQRGGSANPDGLGEDTYKAYTRWLNAAGNGIDESSMVHKLYPNLASVSPTPVITPNCPSGRYYVPTAAEQCVDCPGDLTSSGGTDTTCECPVGQIAVGATGCRNPAISPLEVVGDTSHKYESWHLRMTDGEKELKTFTFRNPATSERAFRTSTVTISGDAFTITSNTCTNTSIAPGGTCTVTVQFYPQSGGAFNRLAYATNRTGSATVSNNEGLADTAVSFEGKAVTDRMLHSGGGFGDDTVTPTEGRLYSYSPTCYRDVESCASAEFYMQLDGNLAVFADGCRRGWWGGGVAGNPGKVGVIQGNGNFAVYRQDGSLGWHTNALGVGNYVQLRQGGVLDVMNSGGEVAHRVIGPGSPCV